MMIQRYGLKLGRLWIRWPEFAPRDLWIGFRVEEPYWEMGKYVRTINVCLVPTIVFLIAWYTKGPEA